MQIKRQELINKLETVAPALAANDLVRYLTHFLFTGTRLLAFNDRIAISTDLKSEFKGAVPGKLLMEVLADAVFSKDVIIKQDEHTTTLQLGRHKSEMGLLSAEAYPFQMPAKPREMSKGVDEKFFTAIEDCLQSVRQYATVPDELGITCIPGRQSLMLFATDVATITRSIVQSNSEFKQRIILTSEFCEQMLRLSKQHKGKCGLSIRKDHALFVAGDVLLFGKLIETADPLPYEAVMSRLIPNDYPKGASELTDRFRAAMKLASHFTEIKGNESSLKVAVDANGWMTLGGASMRGKTADKIELKKHPAVTTKLPVSHIIKGQDRYKTIRITERCALMEREQSIYLVSAIQE